MAHTVYQIRNIKNGRCYFGATCDPARRRWQHDNKLKAKKHPSAALQADYDALGPDAFVFQELAEYETKEQAVATEKLLLRSVDCYNTVAPGYEFSTEHRSKISAARRAYMHDNAPALERAAAIGRANLGRSHPSFKRAVIRSDGVEFPGVLDAAKAMEPERVENARCRIRQALKLGTRTYGFQWKYKEPKPNP